MIPEHLSNLIWEAITDVPRIEAGRSRLTEVFTQPPTYDDYLTAIKSHKKPRPQACLASLTDTSRPFLRTSRRPRTKCFAPSGQPSTYRNTGNNAGSYRCPKRLNSITSKTSGPYSYSKSFANYRPAFSRTAFALPGKPMTCLTRRNTASAPNMAQIAPPSYW